MVGIADIFMPKNNVSRSEMQQMAERALTADARILGNEGFRPDIYKDTMNRNTVGFGFNIDDPTVRKLIPQDILSGQRLMNRTEALDIHSQLTKRAFEDARSFVGDETFSSLSTAQRTALTDMAYNLGLTSLNTFDNLRSALQSGNFEQAALEVLDSKYAKQVPNRARQNANLIGD